MTGPGGREASRLVGRAAELDRIAALIARAATGTGGALCVEGTPGVGKSALLAALDAPRLRVLSATGVETEIDLPFAGLAELVTPLLPLAAGLPAAQLGALRSALALDAPAGAERVLVLQAVVALLEAAAAERPLLLLVDDVQWLDPSSQEAIAFVARRAERLPLALVAVRSLRGEPFEPWPGVERLALADLPRAEALALARAGGLAPPVAEALVDAVGGNPLALVEAPSALTPAQRAGGTALPDPLPAGERLHRTYAARVAALPAETREALLLAAASGTGATGPLMAALTAPASASPFAAAEEAGLVRVAPDRIRFAHPLVRSAVYHAATHGSRRAAHRALADAGPERERAWHLAAAATAPDEQLAASLAALAHDARERGAPATAATVFERAARLSPDPAQAAARTIAAAGMATLASQPARARALIDALLPALEDPLARADAQFVRGAAILQDGRPMEAHALLEAEAERIAGRDPTRAAMLLTQAGFALVAHGSMERLAALAERAVALAPDWVELAPAVLHAEAITALGEHDRARALLRSHADALGRADAVGLGHEILSMAALCMVYMEDYDDAELLLLRLIGTARAKGAVSALALPVAAHGALHIRRGDYDAAAACGAEAIALSEDGLDGFVLTLALMTAAFVESHRGEAAACIEHAARAMEISAALDLTATFATAEQALGMLNLGLGDTAQAIVHLERARAHTAKFGSRDPNFLYTPGDLVDAYVRAGRDDDARTVTAELAAGAAATGSAWATAVTARCTALLDGDERIDAHLATALAAHERVAMPFELARTQLAFGERLRRARRRADARELLSAAHTAFTALGTTPWARRAASELAAAGGPRAATGRDATATANGAVADPLTAREDAVCELVAGGATNREAAAALFLSPRTVEHHLRQAYRKLGVRSRTELAAHWREQARQPHHRA